MFFRFITISKHSSLTSFILNNKLDKEEKLEKLMQNKVAFMMKM